MVFIEHLLKNEFVPRFYMTYDIQSDTKLGFGLIYRVIKLFPSQRFLFNFHSPPTSFSTPSPLFTFIFYLLTSPAIYQEIIPLVILEKIIKIITYSFSITYPLPITSPCPLLEKTWYYVLHSTK
jgi:hypothetical protein